MRDKLIKIQSELKAPKNQRNDFGKYNYRSCEDILEAVKPLLLKHECSLTLSDEIEEVGGRVYVRATARIFSSGGGEMSTSAFAREADVQKGMSEPQITVSASSYARKYALNGLFCIDDAKDADFHNNGQEPKKEEKPAQKPKGNFVKAMAAIKASPTIADLDKICKFIDQNSWTEDEAKELDIANSAMRDGLK